MNFFNTSEWYWISTTDLLHYPSGFDEKTAGDIECCWRFTKSSEYHSNLAILVIFEFQQKYRSRRIFKWPAIWLQVRLQIRAAPLADIAVPHTAISLILVDLPRKVSFCFLGLSESIHCMERYEKFILLLKNLSIPSLETENLYFGSLWTTSNTSDHFRTAVELFWSNF